MRAPRAMTSSMIVSWLRFQEYDAPVLENEAGHFPQ